MSEVKWRSGLERRYIDRDQQLVEVALIPPVSGG